MAPRYYRKVIKITAEDSPNVKLARAELGAGLEPSGQVILPGVLSWEKFCYRSATWDKVRKTIGLGGEFYEGAETLLYPPDWLDFAERRSIELIGKKRQAISMGVDPAEGGDSTTIVVVDQYGLLELQSIKTPDTSVINGYVLATMRSWSIEPENVIFDIGGGGKQLSDDLRPRGYNVRTVAFGSPPSQEPKQGPTSLRQKIEAREDRYTYKNRRAEMYGELSILLDPTTNGFALPSENTELRRQMSLIPKTYDDEGRLYILPKRRKHPNSTERTLEQILGCSPDELDALVLAVYGLLHKPQVAEVGSINLIGGRGRGR